jgi:hypothetical protein
MAWRSFAITVDNFLRGGDWTRDAYGLTHGIWGPNDSKVPPERITEATLDGDEDVVDSFIYFESESDRFVTGFQGFVDYVRGTDRIHIEWNNPAIGGNSFDVTTPDRFVARWDPGAIGGNNPSVTVSLKKRPRSSR